MANVVELTATMMKREGIEYLFGLPGGMGSIDLMDATEKEGIRFILVKHEGAASIMAAVYGELTGKPGVAVTAVAPGLTNAVNGVAYAYVDRSPMILFNDEYPYGTHEAVLRQKLNTRQVFQGITKWTGTLAPDWAHELLHRAFRTALEDRPGPVQLDIPDDVAKAKVADKPLPPLAKVQSVARLYSQEPAGLDQFVSKIRESRAPAIIVGMGIRWDKSYPQLKAFVERLGAPVFTTVKAKGALPENHPYSAGVFIGGKLELEILGKADLIIGIGLDPADMLAKPWKLKQPMMLIDRVSNSLELFHAESELVGNIGESLSMLAELLPADHKWSETVGPEYRQMVSRGLAMPTEGLAPYRVMEITRELTPDNVIAVSDSGASKLLLCQVWKSYQPDSFFTSNPLGTMGFGVPASIVAKLVHPERPVVGMVGDGGFAMRVNELETAMEEGVAPVLVVMNDRTLSLIKVKQVKRDLRVVGSTYEGAYYAKVAEGYGAKGYTVNTEEEYRAALKEALQSKVMSVIDARIDPSKYQAQFDVIREL